MVARSRLAIWGVVILIAAILALDVLISTIRASRVLIESFVEPVSVVADGKSTAVITIRVTEDGVPRGRALLQLWLGTGAGLLQPNWVYTDEHGMARATFQPSPASRYSPITEDTTIHVADTTVGRLIEMRAEQVVNIRLEMPK